MRQQHSKQTNNRKTKQQNLKTSLSNEDMRTVWTCLQMTKIINRLLTYVFNKKYFFQTSEDS